MKVACLLLTTLALAAAESSIVSTVSHVRQSDDGWMDKQTKVIDLLSWGKMKEAYENEYYDWDIEHQAQYFTDAKPYNYFLKQYHEGFIPREATFSLYCPKTRTQTGALFDLFYAAKDFETFYKAASWARKHVNFGVFAYAFSIAVFNRPDCKGLEIPPIYEIFPNYFVPADVMHKAYKAKMYGQHTFKYQLNYTGYEQNFHNGMYGGVVKQWAEGRKDGEYKMSYFREDVVFNDFYARWFLHYPLWLDTQRMHLPEYQQRGELFYYFHQQIFARYVLERYANDLPNVDFFSWYKPIKTGYNPNLINFHGTPFFTRPDYYSLKSYYPYGVWKAENYEKKLMDSIDAKAFYDSNNTMFSFKGTEGTEWLGKAMTNMPHGVSRGYYGNYFNTAIKTLSYAVKTNTDEDFVGGATSFMMTAMRDPAYYQFLHRMLKFFHGYKKYLPYYTHHELGYPGVKVDSFEVDKLVTYFDFFDFDITYGMGMGKSEQKKDYHYTAKQLRLSHKPFTYKFTVSSEKTEDAMVRIFFGPKFDSNGRELNIEQSRMAFFEMDRFPVKLTSGQNVFERSSKDSTVFAKDFTYSTRTFKEYIAKYSKNYPSYHESFHCGFPEHFQLPKGKKAGMSYSMYIIVTPYDKKYTPASEERYYDAYVTCGSSKFYDYKPFGFPFDRVIPYEEDFYTPNMYFKDVQVFHKDDKDFTYVSHHEGPTRTLTV